MVAEFRSLGPGAKVAGQDAGELADGPVRGEPRPAPLQEHLLPRAAGRKGAGGVAKLLDCGMLLHIMGNVTFFKGSIVNFTFLKGSIGSLRVQLPEKREFERSPAPPKPW